MSEKRKGKPMAKRSEAVKPLRAWGFASGGKLSRYIYPLEVSRRPSFSALRVVVIPAADYRKLLRAAKRKRA